MDEKTGRTSLLSLRARRWDTKKTRHTEEQIAFALKQAETGTSGAEVIRRMGISEQTFYRWKKVYGGLGVGELRRLNGVGAVHLPVGRFGVGWWVAAPRGFATHPTRCGSRPYHSGIMDELPPRLDKPPC